LKDGRSLFGGKWAIAFLVEDVACRLETEFLCTSLGIVAKVTQNPVSFALVCDKGAIPVRDPLCGIVLGGLLGV
jgi:hypothetical protein